ncbi:activator-dependent family glycosyltransferase [Micromonospora sp. DT53]|uniref:activator-dependent family glycosyltransferase n=1 Tax=Micromonospora sp. DT53 TaxID=3393444 RepID=UPI003CF8B9F7
MRVLMNTFAASSHLYPMVSLAWALHAAGHEVRVASQPDLASTIARTSLPAVSVGKPLEMARQMQEDRSWQDEDARAGVDMGENRPEMLTWDSVNRTFDWYLRNIFLHLNPDPVLHDIVEYAREWRPDLVLWDTMTFSGAVAARACGAAHARLVYGQDFIGRMRGHFLRLRSEQPEHLREDPMAEWLGAAVARSGGTFGEDLIVGQFNLDATTVPWLRLCTGPNDVPVRNVPYTGAAPVPEWLPERPARPRICLTAGLGGREVTGDDWVPYQELFDAVADLDVDVVATLNADQLTSVTNIPDNVRLFDFYPLDVLMPTCSAVINHCGSGAIALAMAHGVPQLMIPTYLWWDSAENARALAARGAAIVLEEPTLTAHQLRSSLVRLLEDPSFRANAARVRAEFLATPSPVDVVPRLEELTAAHRSR